MRFRAPIGISDFPKLREQGAYYVDKTAFVTDVLLQGKEVVLFPRPRRFGKTLNRSSAIGKAGEVFVLDMGTSAKIVDIARDPIRLRGFVRTTVATHAPV